MTTAYLSTLELHKLPDPLYISRLKIINSIDGKTVKLEHTHSASRKEKVAFKGLLRSFTIPNFQNFDEAVFAYFLIQ
jgi:hypothetical protein